MAIWGNRWTACCNDVMVLFYEDEDLILYASDDCQTYRDQPPEIKHEDGIYVSYYGKLGRDLKKLSQEQATQLLEWSIVGFETTLIATIGVVRDGQLVTDQEALPVFYEKL